LEEEEKRQVGDGERGRKKARKQVTQCATVPTLDFQFMNVNF
jgi:hypothetical protein